MKNKNHVDLICSFFFYFTQIQYFLKYDWCSTTEIGD